MSLTEVLDHLRERNAVHIVNIGDCYSLPIKPNEFIGEPRATEYMTVEQLKQAGVRGLYRRAAK